MKKIAITGLIVTSIALVSCGGSVNTIPAGTVIPGSLQNYLNTPTYVTGTEELAAFNAINTFRFGMGLGYWQQNVLLDQAAAAHMAYSKANDPTFQQDLETSGATGFTGITPSARAIAQGYYYLANTVNATNVPTASVGELYAVGTGASAVSSMINTIYHRSGLMAQGTVQMGLARDTAGAATANTHWWLNHGRLTSAQSVASNYFAQYPSDGAVSVPLSMSLETPSVFTSYTTAAQFAANTSSPVSVHTSASTNLTVTSFTVSVAGSSTPLPGKVWMMANDPNLNTNNYSTATLNLTTPPTPTPTIPAYEAYWVGTQPFLPNTTYTATFTGSTYLLTYGLTNTITKTWNFTTGSN